LEFLLLPRACKVVFQLLITARYLKKKIQGQKKKREEMNLEIIQILTNTSSFTKLSKSHWYRLREKLKKKVLSILMIWM
jgi:hypothetical protein